MHHSRQGQVVKKYPWLGTQVGKERMHHSKSSDQEIAVARGACNEGKHAPFYEKAENMHNSMRIQVIKK